MPVYAYQCPTHGYREIRKPMAEAALKEFCPRCPDAVAMPRVWSVPSLIVRPHGYHLRPGEPGYWDINRTLEVGHVPMPDERSNLGAGAPTDDELWAEEYAGVELAQPSGDDLQKLAEVARATFSESGSRL